MQSRGTYVSPRQKENKFGFATLNARFLDYAGVQKRRAAPIEMTEMWMPCLNQFDIGLSCMLRSRQRLLRSWGKTRMLRQHYPLHRSLSRWDHL